MSGLVGWWPLHDEAWYQQEEGIDMGYQSSNLEFFPNEWGGGSNAGEVDITGDHFIDTLGNKRDITPINNGIACEETDATTSGYIMYSEQSVHNRFSANPPHTDNCDHLIGVRYNSGWEYDTNGTFHSFTPNNSDILIASMEWGISDISKLNNDTVRDLSGRSNHGTLDGQTKRVAGSGGQSSLYVEGGSGRVDLGPPSEHHFNGSFTISTVLWDYDGATGTDPIISNNHKSWSGMPAGYTLGYYTSNVDGRDADVYVYLKTGNSANGQHAVTDGYHPKTFPITVTGVHEDNGDGTFTNRIYLNGELGDESTVSYGMDESGYNTYLNHSPYNSNYGNTKVLSDVRFYNRALADSEISTLSDWRIRDYTSPPTDGVAYYPLDGNATDEWGTNDGTNNGATFVNDSVRGQAARFDGSSHIEVDNTSLFENTSTFSISTWINHNNPGGYARAINREHIFYAGIDDSNLAFMLGDGSGWNDRLIETGELEVPVPENTWNHVVYCKDGTKYTVYLNGTPYSATGSMESTGSNTQPTRIGASSNDTTSQNWDGEIDDLRLYNRALEPWEVFELYQWGTRGRDMRKFLVNQ